MPAKKAPSKRPVAKVTVAAAPVEDAPGEAPPDEPTTLNAAGWRDPASVYAADDNSIDARMWRLEKDRAPK